MCRRRVALLRAHAVEPSDPDAAPAPELPALFGGGGSDSAGTASAGNANNPFEGLGNAIKNARMSAQQRAAADEQKRVAALEESDGANPLQKAIGDGLTALTSGDPADFNLPAMLQKLGQGLSQAAPKLNPLALLNANKLDPRAMEEAGLPAASSVPQLMSSFLKDAMGERRRRRRQCAAALHARSQRAHACAVQLHARTSPLT